MLFDTHAHYDNVRFDSDREELLGSLPENGVGLVVNPGCDLRSSRKALDMARRWDHMYAAVGIHPEDCKDLPPDWLAQVEAMAKEEKVAAVGEIGLDRHWPDAASRELQESVFRAQLELAGRLGLPAIVHERDACGDCLRIIRDYPGIRGVWHCFSGSRETLSELMRLGWYVSFTGIVTFPNSLRAAEAAAEVPADRYLLETDAPYLAPIPWRGRRNSSLYLKHTAEKIAGLRGVTPAEVEAQTWENGLRFFGIRP